MPRWRSVREHHARRADSENANQKPLGRAGLSHTRIYDQAGQCRSEDGEQKPAAGGDAGARQEPCRVGTGMAAVTLPLLLAQGAHGHEQPRGRHPERERAEREEESGTVYAARMPGQNIAEQEIG